MQLEVLYVFGKHKVKKGGREETERAYSCTEPLLTWTVV